MLLSESIWSSTHRSCFSVSSCGAFGWWFWQQRWIEDVAYAVLTWNLNPLVPLPPPRWRGGRRSRNLLIAIDLIFLSTGPVSHLCVPWEKKKTLWVSWELEIRCSDLTFHQHLAIASTTSTSFKNKQTNMKHKENHEIMLLISSLIFPFWYFCREEGIGSYFYLLFFFPPHLWGLDISLTEEKIK